MTPLIDLIDVHCHLDSDRLGRDVGEVIEEARAAGVTSIIMAGVDPRGWRAQVALAERHGDVHPVFGIHPQLVPELDEAQLEVMLGELEAALRGDYGMRPVALGELGLDRLTEASRAALPLQEVAFREQLRLAKRFELPIVLHLLRSDDLALKVLREEGVGDCGGLVHSYSGAREFARALCGLGLHISFSGSLARPQSRRLRESALEVPLDRLLIETDTPDQSPPPHQGKPNRPALLPLIARALATARGESLEAIALATSQNARRLLRLEG
jgi:TatD DNase family protein